MTVHQVYIAIGSNLGNPIQQAMDAIEALKTIPKTTLITVSSLYGSKPMGPADQPDYVNAVALLQTELLPLELLDHTQRIELEHGRVRKDERWGPRTLDLDMLLYNNQVIDSPRLTLPHYGMKEREFVIYPLLEIAPDLIMPDGTSIQSLTDTLALNGLHRVTRAC